MVWRDTPNRSANVPRVVWVPSARSSVRTRAARTEWGAPDTARRLSDLIRGGCQVGGGLRAGGLLRPNDTNRAFGQWRVTMLP
jgi:hypothetical protein